MSKRLVRASSLALVSIFVLNAPVAFASDSWGKGGGFPGGGFPGGDNPGDCVLGTKWQTSDLYQPHPTDFAQAAAITHNSHVVLAAGSIASAALNDFKWTVRVYDSSAGSWTTTQSGLSGVTAQSFASGAAAGPSGEFYVVGGIASGVFEGWVTEKSTDNGKTWKIVDTFLPSGLGASAAATAVAVDGSGHVYVAGIQRKGGASIWTVRRSVDGGATWTIVDTVTSQFGDASPFAMVASASGQVFVAGRDVPVSGQTSDYWFVRESTNGTTWTTVDQFRPTGFDMNPRGAALGLNGEVIVSGAAIEPDGSVHWLTREATLTNPTTWTTIDDYLASGKYGEGNAAIFSLSDEIFVTGTDIEGTGNSAQEDFLTRRGFSGSAFENSDQVASPLPGTSLGFNIHGGQSATIDETGSIYAAGTVNTSATSANPHAWIVRVLMCN